MSAIILIIGIVLFLLGAMVTGAGAILSPRRFTDWLVAGGAVIAIVGAVMIVFTPI